MISCHQTYVILIIISHNGFELTFRFIVLGHDFRRDYSQLGIFTRETFHWNLFFHSFKVNCVLITPM